MSNLVVRGLATSNVVVTAGLGPDTGTTFFSALAGVITMVGSLSAVFIPAGDDDAAKNQGGIRIDIDTGI